MSVLCDISTPYALKDENFRQISKLLFSDGERTSFCLGQLLSIANKERGLRDA
jgi:hypothetical protein